MCEILAFPSNKNDNELVKQAVFNLEASLNYVLACQNKSIALPTVFNNSALVLLRMIEGLKGGINLEEVFGEEE